LNQQNNAPPPQQRFPGPGRHHPAVLEQGDGRGRPEETEPERHLQRDPESVGQDPDERHGLVVSGRGKMERPVL